MDDDWGYPHFRKLPDAIVKRNSNRFSSFTIDSMAISQLHLRVQHLLDLHCDAFHVYIVYRRLLYFDSSCMAIVLVVSGTGNGGIEPSPRSP